MTIRLATSVLATALLQISWVYSSYPVFLDSQYLVSHQVNIMLAAFYSPEHFLVLNVGWVDSGTTGQFKKNSYLDGQLALFS